MCRERRDGGEWEIIEGRDYVSERKHGGGALRRREPRVARLQVHHTSRHKEEGKQRYCIGVV